MTASVRALLDAVRRPAGRATPEYALLLATATVLLVLGLVMSFSASFVRSTVESGDAFEVFLRQLGWAAVGLVPMVVAARSDYRLWRRVAGLVLVVGLVLSALVVIPGVGLEAHGARRWLPVGPLTVQPSELLKLGVPLYLAHVLARRWGKVRSGDLHALLMPALPLLAVVAVLVMAEPDLETTVLLLAIGGLLLYSCGLPWRVLALGGAVAAALGTLAITEVGFRTQRIEAWLDPMSDAGGTGYQSVQGLLALGSGGWLGTGLGQGRAKWLFLPNADTDTIFAVIGEELGLLGALLVLLMYAALAIGGVRAARAAPDPFGRLIATAITGWLVMQAALNMASVVGLLPVTGVTLPLVSVGGSSLVVTMTAVGLLLGVARAARPLGTSPPAADDVPDEASDEAPDEARARARARTTERGTA